MTTTIRLRGPADIITVLPYHLGYRPADSLVVVCLEGTRIGVVGRIDLPPPQVDPQLLVDEILPLVLREQPDRVVIVGFESVAGAADPASVAMRDALAEAGLLVADRLLVRDGRWWSLDCTGDCCPSQGEPVPAEEEVPAVAEYIVLGRRPAATRADLADRLAHRTDRVQDSRCAVLMHDLARARASRTSLQRRRRRALGDWGRILDVGPDGDGLRAASPLPDDEGWAWAVVSLLDVPVRDLLIAWMCPGTLDLGVFPVSLRRLGEQLLPPRRMVGVSGVDVDDDDDDDGERMARVVERLAMVCRASPPELSPGPLTVLAHVAWWMGDGALARTAVDQALEVDPEYRLATLLERMVDAAVRPRRSA